MSKYRGRRGAIVALVALVAVACGDDGDAPGTSDGDGGTEAAADAETCADLDLASTPDEPVSIRFGHGFAAEEPFWLMSVDPDLAEHKGSWYELDLLPFRGTEERMQAYQAGELDAVVVSPQAQIRGHASGALDLYAIATVMREAEPTAYSGTFVALDDAGIDGPEDFAGKRVAVVDIGSQWDFLARAAAASGGLDPETDVEYVVLPFPTQEEALREGQIDVAGLPEPLYSLAMGNGGLVDVVAADELTDFAYDLLSLSFNRDFVEDNLGAVCAFAADYQEAMDAYRSDRDAARTQLAESDFISIPLEVYLETGDYARPEGGLVDTEGMQSMLDTMIDFGILTEDDRVDVEELVRPGVSLGH